MALKHLEGRHHVFADAGRRGTYRRERNFGYYFYHYANKSSDENVRASGAIRLIKPDNTLPGPISTNVST